MSIIKNTLIPFTMMMPQVPYSIHCKLHYITTAYIKILSGRIFHEFPVGEDFCDLFSQSPILPKDIGNRVGYHCSNHTAAKEVLVHLPSDLSCYCRFKETLLTPSRVVDTSTIYLCRYAIAVFVASMCKSKSGGLW